MALPLFHIEQREKAINKKPYHKKAIPQKSHVFQGLFIF